MSADYNMMLDELDFSVKKYMTYLLKFNAEMSSCTNRSRQILKF